MIYLILLWCSLFSLIKKVCRFFKSEFPDNSNVGILFLLCILNFKRNKLKQFFFFVFEIILKKVLILKYLYNFVFFIIFISDYIFSIKNNISINDAKVEIFYFTKYKI